MYHLLLLHYITHSLILHTRLEFFDSPEFAYSDLDCFIVDQVFGSFTHIMRNRSFLHQLIRSLVLLLLFFISLC